MSNNPNNEALYDIGDTVVFQMNYRPANVMDTEIPEGTQATVKGVEKSIKDPTKFKYSVQFVDNGPLTNHIEEDALAPA